MFKIAEYFTEEERRAAAEAVYDQRWAAGPRTLIDRAHHCPLGVMFRVRTGGKQRWSMLNAPEADTVAAELSSKWHGPSWREVHRRAAYFITRWDREEIEDLHAALGVKRVRDS